MPAYGPRVSERAGWVDQLRDAAKHALLVVALAALPLLGSPHTAYAENELAAQCGGKFDSSLIDRQCFASSCKAQTQACLENSECMKGLVCTARCLGDTKCISGCFARFGNADIDGLIQCSIEDNACLKVAILQPGPEDPAQAPPPPVPVLKDFQPKSLEGRWYKVMGWNSMYDCYDCQLNKFATIAAAAPAPAPAGGAQASPRTTAFDAATSGMSVQRADEALQQLAERPSSAMQVDVDFDMPRPATLLRSGHNHQHLRERLDFDAPGSARTAHTHGSMFGLSFWENWYGGSRSQAPACDEPLERRSSAPLRGLLPLPARSLPAHPRHPSPLAHCPRLQTLGRYLLGENARGEPQFKFVYYNGCGARRRRARLLRAPPAGGLPWRDARGKARAAARLTARCTRARARVRHADSRAQAHGAEQV